jgi:hypothetical protein
VLEIGFGRAGITPAADHWPIWLAGYGDRRDPAECVHDDLDARVMVARSDSVTVALVVTDLMAMSRDWAGAIRRGVADELGVGVESVLTSTIHTHAAPSTITGTEALGWPVAHSWQPDLVAACRAAARAAADGTRPVSLRFARIGLPPALSFNRRNHVYAPTYAVLDVLEANSGDGRRGTGHRLGTIVNFGVHAVVLGPKNLAVSADWVGVCRREVEARLGGTTFFVQGCQGDVDPHGMQWDGDQERAFAAVERVGEDFALAAVAAAAVARPVAGAEHERASVASAHRRMTLDASGSGLAAITGRATVDVELFEWTIGGVRFVTVPGEGFAQLGEAIVVARATAPTVLCGFAPDWLGYLPVPFTEGYEEGLSYGPNAVGAIVEALIDVP